MSSSPLEGMWEKEGKPSFSKSGSPATVVVVNADAAFRCTHHDIFDGKTKSPRKACATPGEFTFVV